MEFRKCLAVLIGLALTATGLWAAGDSDSDESAATAEKEMVLDPTTGEMVEAPRYGGTITCPLIEEYDNPDVVLSGPWGSQFFTGVLEKLGTPDWGIDRAEYDFSGLSAPLFAITGQLAESWSQPDPLTYIVKVRQGVHWHDKPPMNGRELTAQDIEYNYHRLMGLGSGFTEPTQFTQALKSLSFESITATDESTVVFKLKEPHLNALAAILDDWIAYMYPPEVIKQYGDATDWQNLVGTGPFILTDVVEGSSKTFIKNPDYWGTDEKYPENRLPYVDEIRGLIMPEVATYLAALRAGKLDYVGNGLGNINTIDQAESIERTNPEFELRPIYGNSKTNTGLNVNKQPFDDIRVRQAMQMAINLEEINQAFFKGFADTTPRGLIGDGGIGYHIPFDQWPEELKKVFSYDPQGAEALLDAAGYPRGADGIRFKSVYTHNDRYDLNLTELLASYWREIGADVEVRVTIGAELVAKRNDRDFEMISHEAGYGGVSDPLVGRRFLAATSYNSAAVSDPDYEALFETAAAATTIEEQQRLVKEMDMYAIERHWAVWGPMAPLFDATQPWLKGYSGEFRLSFASKNWVFARLWIDQDLKAAMGF